MVGSFQGTAYAEIAKELQLVHCLHDFILVELDVFLNISQARPAFQNIVIPLVI